MSMCIQASNNVSNKLSLVDFVTNTMCHIRMSTVDGHTVSKILDSFKKVAIHYNVDKHKLEKLLNTVPANRTPFPKSMVQKNGTVCISVCLPTMFSAAIRPW